MGNYMNKANKTSMNFLNKYKDHKAHDEFKNYYDNYVKKMEQSAKQSGKNSILGRTFKKYMPSSIMNIKTLMGDNNFSKINKYIKAPTYKQKYYNYELKFKRIFKNRREYYKYFRYSYYQESFTKQNVLYKFNPSNAKQFIINNIKRNTRKFFLYVLSIFMFIYTIKYIFYRMTSGRQDKNLKEALEAIKELKSQNEELMKYNRDLMKMIK